MEYWKPIKGYEGLYEVSSEGNVYSTYLRRNLRPGRGRYLIVTLCKNGEHKQVAVHRLVAEAFCEKATGKTEVNHINENRYDNRATNLEWCTRLENIRHGSGIERHALAQRNKKGSKAVEQWSLDGVLVKTYLSIHEMYRQTGYDRAFVARCAKHKNKTAYGYKWTFSS